MIQDINIADATIYVGTYKKYNEGSLYGDYLKLSDYASKEDFYKTCRKLHKDEQEPEYMFQDFEDIPRSLIAESWLSDRFFEVRDAIENIIEKQKPFLIWCNNGHRDLSQEDIDDLIGDFENDYIGHYDSEEDYVRELIEERSDLSAFAKQYFDYEAYTTDLFCGEYWCEDGHIFYNS